MYHKPKPVDLSGYQKYVYYCPDTDQVMFSYRLVEEIHIDRNACKVKMMPKRRKDPLPKQDIIIFYFIGEA